MIQVKLMTEFALLQTGSFVPKWFLMMLEGWQEVIKELLPILYSCLIKL